MSWKQPIRSSMPEFGEDVAAETLYVLLLRSAANSEKKFLIDDQVVTLQRGQAVYGRYSYAKKLGLKRNEGQRVDRTLSRLAKVHNKINISPKNKFSLITLKNYEEEVDMNTNSNNSINNGQTTDKQQINTNKSVESEKSVGENAIFSNSQEKENLSREKWLAQAKLENPDLPDLEDRIQW